MEEKVKKILSAYLKVPIEQILPSSVINRASLGSSIIVHRMYANFAAEGIVVENYQDVNTLSDLIEKIKQKDDGSTPSHPIVDNSKGSAGLTPVRNESMKELKCVGIDIEHLNAFPKTNDFRDHSFYSMNFTEQEIAYCILQTDSYASFAGIFAAKEAIVKADNGYKNIEFKNISIEHGPDGNPIHQSFYLSISHSNETAIAIALQKQGLQDPQIFNSQKNQQAEKGLPIWLYLFLFLNFTISLICIVLLLQNRH